jgi:hypothetical protein
VVESGFAKLTLGKLRAQPGCGRHGIGGATAWSHEAFLIARCHSQQEMNIRLQIYLVISGEMVLVVYVASCT